MRYAYVQYIKITAKSSCQKLFDAALGIKDNSQEISRKQLSVTLHFDKRRLTVTLLLFWSTQEYADLNHATDELKISEVLNRAIELGITCIAVGTLG